MIILTVDNKDYPLKITTRAAMNMEEQLGFNPLNVLLRMKYTEELPKFKDVMVILHNALQPLNHGITFTDTTALFDKYCEEGGSIIALLEIIVKAFEESGLIKIEDDPNA